MPILWPHRQVTAAHLHNHTDETCLLQHKPVPRRQAHAPIPTPTRQDTASSHLPLPAPTAPTTQASAAP